MLSESKSKTTGWTAGDFLLTVLFLLGTGWGVWELFLPHTKSTPNAPLTLRPQSATNVPVNMDLVYERIRTAQPVRPRPEWVAPQLSGRWKGIVLHHSATLGGSAKSFDQYHKQERKMENGLAYHFVICNGQGGEDGLVEVGERWVRQLDGGHVHGDALNHKYIGICLVGDLRYQAPTEKQLASLKGLVNYLLNVTNLNANCVFRHCDVKDQNTECPGPGLPVEFFLKHRFPSRG